MDEKPASIGQIIGGIILAATTIIPAMALAGFSGGTTWSLLLWLFVSVLGGGIGGVLIVPSHRVAGFVGGMIGGPTGLLGVFLYARNRDVMYRAEAAIVWLVCSLPGVGVYFVGRVLTDLALKAGTADRPRRRRRRREDADDEPRPKRRARYDDEAADDEPRPRRRRVEVDLEDADEESRPRRRRARSDED